MSSGEQGNEHLFDDIVLTDYHFSQFRENALATFSDAIRADSSDRRIHLSFLNA